VICPLGAGDNVGEVTGVVAEDVDVVDAGVVISELEADPDSKSACWLQSEIEFSGEVARDHLRKCHEPGARVGCHGEAALESSGTVGGADPGPEDEGVTAVEGDGWLDED
jgi:hypothetical protein